VSISFENNEQMKRGYFFSIQQNIMLMTNREIILQMSVPEGTLIRSMMKSHLQHQEVLYSRQVILLCFCWTLFISEVGWRLHNHWPEMKECVALFY